MQAKKEERLLAIQLRQQGLSYSEILQHLAVSQSSLSLWLRDIKLSDEQISKLSFRGPLAGAKARRQQRLKQLVELEKEVSAELPRLLKNPFFCIGLALYWAEGAKIKPWRITIRARVSNSDPFMILIMRAWFLEFFKNPKFHYRLYIHESANREIARKKWAELLSVDVVQIPITIKRHEVRSRYKHDNYIGLIELSVRNSAWIARRIDLWTKGAAAHFLAPQNK